MKSRIVITETREDGVYWRHELPESAELTYVPLDVYIAPDGTRRVSNKQPDGIVIQWPLGDTYEIVTNDPEFTEETTS